MSYSTDIQEIGPDDPLMDLAAGGEVGATGMGDDYHYTGEDRDKSNEKEPWSECVISEMTGRGGRQKGVLESIWICTF